LLYPNKTGQLFRFFLPSALWQVKTDKKEIFLTFDDGPIPQVTEWVLETLQRYHAKGTFFCVGDNIRKHPEVFKQIIAEGHSVGNHTYHHLKGWQTHNDAYYLNIWKWEKEVDTLGIKPPNKPLFRPPYGQITFSQAKFLKEKFQIVMWSIITGDFDKGLEKEHCLQKIVKMSNPGTVIVFHDSYKAEANLKFLLPRYLEAMSEKGYVFSPLCR
jgi:peptidoglycan-N-acetylglucosamine deacetylase